MIPGQEMHVAGPVWLVPGEFDGRFPRCHCVYIDDGGGVLIDTGAGDKVLADFLSRRRVELVINTHTHIDHVFGNHLFVGREILVPEFSFETAGNLVKLSRRFMSPDVGPLWRQVTRDLTNWQDHRPTGSFIPGQSITVGSTHLEIIHAPGHVADHCMIHLPQYDLLISADLDLGRFGPWYGHPESDLEQMRRSIQLARNLKPKVVVSSHREPVSENIDEAFVAWGDVINQRERTLLEFLSREQTWERVLDQKNALRTLLTAQPSDRALF